MMGVALRLRKTMTWGSRLFALLVVYTCALPKPTSADSSSDPRITPRCKLARQNEEVNFICCLSMPESGSSLKLDLVPTPSPQPIWEGLNESCVQLMSNTASLGRVVTNVTCVKVPGYNTSEGFLLLQDALAANISKTHNDTHVHLQWEPVLYATEYIVIVNNKFSQNNMSTSLEEIFFPRPCGNVDIEILVNVSGICLGLVYARMHTIEGTPMNLNKTSDFQIIFSDKNKISACLSVQTKRKPTNQKLCLEPYNVTLFNSKNETVHRAVRPWADIRRLSGSDFAAEICIPPKHIQYNMHYTVQLEFDIDTLPKNFSTFDVQDVTVNNSVANKLTVCCKYARGSHAKGCHIEVNGTEKYTDLLRSNIHEDSYTFEELEESEYEILVWDIEEDNPVIIYSEQPVAWSGKTFVKPGGSAISGTTKIVLAVVIPVVVLVGAAVSVLIAIYKKRRQKRRGRGRIERDGTAIGPRSETKGPRRRRP